MSDRKFFAGLKRRNIYRVATALVHLPCPMGFPSGSEFEIGHVCSLLRLQQKNRVESVALSR